MILSSESEAPRKHGHPSEVYLPLCGQLFAIKGKKFITFQDLNFKAKLLSRI